MAVKDLLKDRLEKGREAGHHLVMITMDQGEILRLIDLIEREAEPVNVQDYQKGLEDGKQMGYQRALVDVIKRLKGMKWYGGDGQKHADKVPGDYPGRAADLQR